MIKIYTPKDEVQIAILKSIFEAEGVPIYVHNDTYGSMRPGIQIPLLNQRAIMVSETHLEKAKEIIQGYLQNIDKAEAAAENSKTQYTFWDKVRMVFEGLLFGWVMPGRHRPKKGAKAVHPENQADENSDIDLGKG